MSSFLIKGFPLKIEFQYNLSFFCFINDPVESISYEIEKMLIDDVSLLQDGSRICFTESFATDGYPATALYNLENKINGISYDNAYIHCDSHPEEKETKIKITLMPELLVFFKEKITDRMGDENGLAKYITRIVKATLFNDVSIKHSSFGFTDDEFEMEFKLKRE